VSHDPVPGFGEELSAEDSELRQFLATLGPEGLAETDLSFIRVLEDLIELLIARNVIRFTDLPSAAQNKMLQRQQLRDRMRPHLDLLEDERDDPLL